MELREWQYMSKPTGSTTNNSSSGYKKRFEKLIKYHIDHASSELESITKKEISDYSFHLGEHYNNGSSEFDREIKVSYSIKNNTFIFSIRIDNILVENKTVDSYEKLVERLESYMFLPDSGTQEYNDLLTEDLKEWKAMNSPASSSQPVSSSKTNKEKFIELIAYMINNKTADVVVAEESKLDNAGFIYTETRKDPNTADYYEVTAHVDCSRFKDLFTLKVYTDGVLQITNMATGWEEFLKFLKFYFKVPATGTKEYKALTENLNEWHLMNPHTQPTSNSQKNYRSQEDRYKKLIAQIAADGIAKYKVNELTDTVLDFNVNTKYRPEGYRVKIEYNSATDDFSLQVANGTAIKGNDWNEDILTLLGVGAVLRETDTLRESVGSIADDFKLYENLWD